MKTEALQQLFEDYQNNKGFSGSVLISTAEETVFCFTSGYANRMYGIHNTVETSFDTASITKLFTAAAIILLESKGEISFEDPIHSIVDLSGTKIPKEVKVKHLLTHTSGIADDAEEEKGENYADLVIKLQYSIRKRILRSPYWEMWIAIYGKYRKKRRRYCLDKYKLEIIGKQL